MKLDEVKQKGLNAFFWDFAGILANQGTTLIISVFLARILDPKDFGLLGMVTVIISMAQALTYFGFGESLIQKKESTQVQISTMFYINVLAGLLLTATLFFAAPLIARFYGEPQLLNMTRVLSVCFLILSFNLIQRALLTKDLNFKMITKASIYSSLISGVIGIALAFNDFGIWSLVIKTVLNFLLTSIFIWYYSSWFPKLAFDLSSIKEHWNYGYKMYLSSIIYTVFNQIDSLFIGKMSGALELGFYYRAKSLNQLLVKYSSESLTKVLLPVFSSIQDDYERVIEVAKKSVHVSSFVTFGIMGFLYLEGENLIVLLFGNKWLFSVPYFQIMIFFAYTYPISAVLGNIIQGLGNAGDFLRLEIYKKLLTLVALGFGYFYGISGFLWCTVVISFLGVLMNMYYVQKQIKVRVFVFLNILLYYFLPAAVCALSMLLLHYYVDGLFGLKRIFSFLIFGTAYALMYWSIHHVMKSEGILIVKGVLRGIFSKFKATES